MTNKDGAKVDNANAVRDRLLAARSDASADAENPKLVVVEPAPSPKLSAKAGEVLFEAECDTQPMRTALANGRSVTLPYVTSDESDIAELRAFAKHTNSLVAGGNVVITEGE